MNPAGPLIVVGALLIGVAFGYIVGWCAGFNEGAHEE